MFICGQLLLAAVPFWETKPPNQWTDAELLQMLTDSPWAQMVGGPGKASPALPVLVFLATAEPMRLAEQERERRAALRRPPTAGPTEEDVMVEEYHAWLEENRARQFVVAVRIPDTKAFADEAEVRRMEEECVLKIGRKKIRMTGHFPPTARDPYLRLAFPRQVQPGDKTMTLELYLPGVPVPFRVADFTLKDMVVRGKLEL